MNSCSDQLVSNQVFFEKNNVFKKAQKKKCARKMDSGSEEKPKGSMIKGFFNSIMKPFSRNNETKEKGEELCKSYGSKGLKLKKNDLLFDNI